jgi:hypothetical protein
MRSRRNSGLKVRLRSQAAANSSSSKAHRGEGYLASVQMKVVIFTVFFCSPAECSSAAATAPRHRTGLGTTIKNVRTC